jgi:hypothetical protein
MVNMDESRDDSPGAVAFAPPPKVSQLAARRGLGVLLGSRKLTNPIASAGGWLVVSLACFTVLYLDDIYLPAGLADSLLTPIVFFVELLFILAGVAAFGLAIRVLVIGARAYFIYTGGFVYLHNGRAATLGWSDVTGLRAIYGMRGSAAGKPQHYELGRAGGPAVRVPPNIVDGRDAFVDELAAIVRRLGRPTP